MNERGDAVAVWDRYETDLLANSSQPSAKSFVVAAARPAGAGWGDSKDLSPGGSGHIPQVAVDPQGNAVAIWRTQAQNTTVIEAAGYDAAGPLLRDLQVPGAATVGSPVSFSVAPVDVWSSVASTHWDFGDGSAADGKTPSHSYGTLGSHEVTVTSTDSLGNATRETRTVTVTRPVSAGDGGAGGGGSGGGNVVTTPGGGQPAGQGAPPAAGRGGQPPAGLQRSALRRCLGRARHAKTRARRRKAKRRCMMPGRVGHLRARALSRGVVLLSFAAPGSVGGSGPAARRFVVKQSMRPIRGERGFGHAFTLCGGRGCGFAPSRVGQRLKLQITDLRPHRRITTRSRRSARHAARGRVRGPSGSKRAERQPGGAGRNTIDGVADQPEVGAESAEHSARRSFLTQRPPSCEARVRSAVTAGPSGAVSRGARPV